MSGKTIRPHPQNMNTRLDCGAAAFVDVMTEGIMYGQKDSARVPKAEMKISATM